MVTWGQEIILLKPSKFWFLILPRDDTWQCTCPLVVCLHQGEGIQNLLPLVKVVHVLEGGVVGVVEVVKGHHDSVVGEGGRGSTGKPFTSFFWDMFVFSPPFCQIM